MKKIAAFLFVFALYLYSPVQVEAQSPKHGFTFHSLFHNYITPQLADYETGDIISESEGRGIELTYNRRLSSPHLFLSVPFKTSVAPFLNKSGVKSRSQLFSSLDVMANFLFFKNGALVRPYLNAGPGLFYNWDTDKFDGNFSTGGGLQFRLIENLYLDAGTQFRIAGNGVNGWNHGLGFSLYFGGTAETIAPPPPPPAPLDTDADGIADAEDKCPTVKGLAAFAGCPDTDADGITDADDLCPTQAGPASFKGCPDTDNDGVADNNDKCPSVAGPVANMGCPYADTDKDGVTDDKDKCPTVAGPASNNGCPEVKIADRDGDGVEDSADACPDKKGEAKYKGCPDTDGDGVADNIDSCPDKKGPAANKGCPEIKAEDKAKLESAIRDVQFATGSATLLDKSKTVLDEVAGLMAKYPEYRLSINGHTDNVGNAASNQSLSERRAKACYDYLATRGVATARMSHAGYGSTQPRADNKTKEGRDLNRRVEFILAVP